MSKSLTLPVLLRRIQHALKYKKAFSLVRIGDGENIVLAQKTVWPIKKVMQEPWTRWGDLGLTLPNLKVRNDLVQSIRKATVVGILEKNDRMIRAPRYLKRSLTDRVFRYYRLNPSFTCNAVVNRIIHDRGGLPEVSRLPTTGGAPRHSQTSECFSFRSETR